MSDLLGSLSIIVVVIIIILVISFCERAQASLQKRLHFSDARDEEMNLFDEMKQGQQIQAPRICFFFLVSPAFALCNR